MFVSQQAKRSGQGRIEAHRQWVGMSKMKEKLVPGSRAENGVRTCLYGWLRKDAIDSCLGAALGLGLGFSLAASATWLGAAGGGVAQTHTASKVSHLLDSCSQDHGKGPEH